MVPTSEDPSGPPPLDVPRLVETLDRHKVDFIVVGGAAAIGHGALRPTEDLDCLPHPDPENLQRLAAAMRELGARIAAEGLTDEESRQLPVILDAQSLSRMEVSTWMTDAGPIDLLTDIPDRSGKRLTYVDLNDRAENVDTPVAIRIAGLNDIIDSKEWANRPKDHAALPELYALRDARTAADLAGPGFGQPQPQPQHPQAPARTADTRPQDSPHNRSPDRDVGR